MRTYGKFRPTPFDSHVTVRDTNSSPTITSSPHPDNKSV